MAQANAAQREPSMEEILASIRRIIEDSDTDRATANDDKPEAPSTARRVMAVEMRSPDATPGSQDEEAAFRSELRGSTAEPPTKVAPSPAQPSPAAAAVTRSPVEAAPAARTEQAARRDTASPYMSDRTDGPAMQEFQLRPSAVVPASSSAQPVDRASPRQNLISEQAGRQVAAAFGELSDAFAATRRKSFDEVAEEMMRPMLREWMDNNLPHLVERLVREEIDRIARGGGS